MSLGELGAAFLFAAMVLAAISAMVSTWSGARQDPYLARVGRRAFVAATLMVVGASAVLVSALVGHDFSIAYVVVHSDRSLPLPLLVASFYGGQEGSLLYWTLVLTVVGALSLAPTARTGLRLSAYATGVLAAISFFFLLMLALVASPFDLLQVAPSDGLGLNPVLQDGGMLIHPPFQLAGYAAFGVPFAFAMAALLAGRQDAAWIAQTRRVALVAWGLESVGLTLGMWWAYHVLGWGGYWGWDPVENVALMPWLLTTAYLHSAQAQERRGQLRAWTQTLVVLAFLLSVFGTFVVRSGILPSVHSFSVSPLGPWFFGFLAACVLVALGALAVRSGGRHSEPIDHAVSREGAFVLQNLLLAALTAAILWGTLLPLVSGLGGRGSLVVGPAYYVSATAPLLVLLLALLAAGPLLPWRRAGRAWPRVLAWPAGGAALALAALLAAGVRDLRALLVVGLVAAAATTALLELARGARFSAAAADAAQPVGLRALARHRRRYGAHLAHLGVAVLAAGIAGSHLWQQERDVTLQPGQSVTVAGRTLVYTGAEERVLPGHSDRLAVLVLDGDARLEPALAGYDAMGGQSLTRAAISSDALEDVYVVLVALDGGSATLRVLVNPLVTWIWAGAAILVFGLLVGNLGPSRDQPRVAVARAPAPVPS